MGDETPEVVEQLHALLAQANADMRSALETGEWSSKLQDSLEIQYCLGRARGVSDSVQIVVNAFGSEKDE